MAALEESFGPRFSEPGAERSEPEHSGDGPPNICSQNAGKPPAARQPAGPRWWKGIAEVGRAGRAGGRWQKVFGELKNKLEEGQAWASSATAKTMQAQFLC
jgi:hypothetical protein